MAETIEGTGDMNITLREQRRKAAKPLLYISIAGMAMMFAGLTSGYIVGRTSLIEDGRWFEFALPNIFYASTVAVILISLFLHRAVVSIKKDNNGQANIMMLVSVILGVAFVVFQFLGWQALMDAGIYLTGQGSHSAGSWVYIITALHVLHLLAGIIVLIVTYIKLLTGKYSSKDYLGIELCTTYWHFVDVLWVYLFIFLSFIR